MKVNVRKVSNDWTMMPGGLTYYFIGQPKSGKTTASSCWSEKGHEGVLIIDTDLGSDFVDEANTVTVTGLNTPYRAKMHKDKVVMKNGEVVQEVTPNDERGFYHRTGKEKGKPCEVYALSEVYEWLYKEWDSLAYDTIVLDTVDQVNQWIEVVVCNELEIGSMGEGQWGADWGKARRRNLDLVNRFQKFLKSKGATFILISHAKSTQIQDGKVQLAPELPRGLAYALTAKADVIGYSTADKDTGEYNVSFEAYDERTVGSRLKPLSQKILPFTYNSIKDEILNYKETKNGRIQTK